MLIQVGTNIHGPHKLKPRDVDVQRVTRKGGELRITVSVSRPALLAKLMNAIERRGATSSHWLSKATPNLYVLVAYVHTGGEIDQLGPLELLHKLPLWIDEGS